MYVGADAGFGNGEARKISRMAVGGPGAAFRVGGRKARGTIRGNSGTKYSGTYLHSYLVGGRRHPRLVTAMEGNAVPAGDGVHCT